MDIDAYFERIGFAGSIAPSLETLQQLHALHPAAIPFENLDPLLGVPVRLELGNLQQKLLIERRGGYCLEQNLLFRAMLEDLDYKVKALAARVYWNHGETEERPFSHMALLVEVGGAPYIADVGFSGLTPTAPLRLRAEIEQQTPHGTYRLMRAEPAWRLELKIGEDWKLLYVFDLTERSVDDFVAINDVVSTSGTQRDNLIAARSEKGRRLTLRNARFAIRPVDGEPDIRMIASVEDAKNVLANEFGIALPLSDRLDGALEMALAKGGS